MKFVPIALMAGVFGGCGSALAAPVSLAQIQTIDDQFGAAVRAGKGGAVADLYAADAVVMPAGAPTVSGEAAIRKYWTGGVAGLDDAILKASSVQSLGSDYAREIGAFTLKLKSPAGPALTGKYVVIWKNVSGRWRLWTDIWNSDAQ